MPHKKKTRKVRSKGSVTLNELVAHHSSTVRIGEIRTAVLSYGIGEGDDTVLHEEFAISRSRGNWPNAFRRAAALLLFSRAGNNATGTVTFKAQDARRCWVVSCSEITAANV